MARRQRVWQRLAREWRLADLERFAVEISLEQLSDTIDAMLAGQHRGRTVINLGA